MSSLSYQTELDFAVALALRAGAQILAGSKSRQSGVALVQSSKMNRVDLVTETDQAVEKMVIGEISGKFPEHKFIGEESYAAGAKADLTADPTWICDPIDGTTNFTHGFPFVCISLGFVVNKVPVIGVIYNPFLKQLYRAVKGHGAYMVEDSGPPIHLPLTHPQYSPLENLGEALIGVEWGSDRKKSTMAMKAESFVKLAGDGKEIQGGIMCHSLRSVGSAAINYANVAAGVMDCYWEIGCWAWDVCAGVVIAREAGGRCYGRGGKPFDSEDLMGHHFFVIRGVADNGSETGEQAQERLAKEFYAAVTEWDA